MPLFIDCAPGQERVDNGIRLAVREDGEAAWFSGKWLDLGADHAVAWIDGQATFVRADGRSLALGQFPAWVVRSKRRDGPSAVMFNVAQFRGGELRIRRGKQVKRYALH